MRVAVGRRSEAAVVASVLDRTDRRVTSLPFSLEGASIGSANRAAAGDEARTAFDDTGANAADWLAERRRIAAIFIMIAWLS